MTDNRYEGGKMDNRITGDDNVQCMMMRMWIEQWLDLVWYEVTLEKMCFKSLTECRSRIYGANGKGETVPDCGPIEGEGPFSESLSVCSWHTKREAVRRWVKLMSMMTYRAEGQQCVVRSVKRHGIIRHNYRIMWAQRQAWRPTALLVKLDWVQTFQIVAPWCMLGAKPF